MAYLYTPGEKKYTCLECDKGFVAAFNLTKHVNSVHRGEKPFKCEFPGCEYASVSASALKNHCIAKHS